LVKSSQNLAEQNLLRSSNYFNVSTRLAILMLLV
jgi:hypothetical protein